MQEEVFIGNVKLNYKHYAGLDLYSDGAVENEIFDILEKTPFGVGGELQLTDAMRELAVKYGMIGVDFSGTRYDMGNKFGILKANIEVGLSHPEVKDELKEYLKALVETL